MPIENDASLTPESESQINKLRIIDYGDAIHVDCHVDKTGLDALIDKLIAYRGVLCPLSRRNPKRLPNGTVKPAILALVTAKPGIRTADIINATRFKDSSVRATLTALKMDGAVVQNDDGTWEAEYA